MLMNAYYFPEDTVSEKKKHSDGNQGLTARAAVVRWSLRIRLMRAVNSSDIVVEAKFMLSD